MGRNRYGPEREDAFGLKESHPLLLAGVIGASGPGLDLVGRTQFTSVVAKNIKHLDITSRFQQGHSNPQSTCKSILRELLVISRTSRQMG